MHASEEQIEQLVRETLARLGRFDRPGESSIISELSLDEAVVTLASLKGKLNGVRRLVVGPKAVVTPAARDLLKEKGVVFVRGRASTSCSSVEVVLAACHVEFDPTSLAPTLEKRGIKVAQLPAKSLVETTKQMATTVAAGQQLGVLLTKQTLLAVCLANRHRGVRAASAISRVEVQQCMTAIGANLIAIDPSNKGHFQIGQLIETFCLSGNRRCPPELAQ